MPRNIDAKRVEFLPDQEVWEQIQRVPKNKRTQFINECIVFATARGQSTPKPHSPQLRIAVLEEQVEKMQKQLADIRDYGKVYDAES